MFELVSAPVVGRIFEGRAAVRLGDSSPGGRVRLDAVARHLQDVSDDDARAAGFGSYTWVVRRTVLAVHHFPAYLERCALRTWCAGFGAASAERRVELLGEQGGRVEAATLWVHLDGASMRPTRLPDEFLHVFGPSAASRRVGSRVQLPSAPAGGWSSGVPWPLRFADFDVLEHVNNAVYWAAVEQHLASRRDLRAPFTAVIEHGQAIERGHEVRWCAVDGADAFHGWLLGSGGEQFAAVRVSAGV